MAAISLNNLTKIYKDTVAVNSLNLEIEEGELFALLGLNGAGKTTTVKMLTTLTKPTRGDAFIYGYSITKEPDAIKQFIDLSMQETAIAKNLTVAENFDFYCALNGINKEQTQAIKAQLFDKFGFEGVANKRAGKLSGGWQRKLSLALALSTSPKVLFLDEPTLGLDVLARRELWSLIKSLKGSTTIVLTTHYMEEAEALADRIGVMKDGALLFVGSKQELFDLTGADNVEDAFVLIVEGNND